MAFGHADAQAAGRRAGFPSSQAAAAKDNTGANAWPLAMRMRKRRVEGQGFPSTQAAPAKDNTGANAWPLAMRMRKRRVEG
ncbi:MAG: hypothetical protein IJ041_03265, partial [Clostridia bacterium]|nr:hypothetical protein [Clostridia bacterium]